MRTRAVLVKERYDSDKGENVEDSRKELVIEDYQASTINLDSDEKLFVKVEGGWLVVKCSEWCDLSTIEGDHECPK